MAARLARANRWRLALSFAAFQKPNQTSRDRIKRGRYGKNHKNRLAERESARDGPAPYDLRCGSTRYSVCGVALEAGTDTSTGPLQSRSIVRTSAQTLLTLDAILCHRSSCDRGTKLRHRSKGRRAPYFGSSSGNAAKSIGVNWRFFGPPVMATGTT